LRASSACQPKLNVTILPSIFETITSLTSSG
jgi:hypothetical protein